MSGAAGGPGRSQVGGGGSRLLGMTLLLVASALFGVLFAVVKGTSGGWHLVFGNLSAPWLVLPVAAGSVVSRRAILAGVVGGVAALVSLVAFYSTTALVWDMVNAQTARNNLTFLIGGAVGAALVTTVSSRFTRRGNVVLVGLLLVCEPIAWVAYDTVQRVSVGAVAGTGPVYAAEVAVGMAVLVVALAFGAAHQRRLTPPG